jgi:hypothetical protein
MMRFRMLALVVALTVSATASAQVLFNPNVGYTQDFDSLGAPPPASLPWTNNTTLTGWYAADGGGAVTTYFLDNGSSAAGGLFSYGTGANRALGSQASNATGQMYWGAQFTNAHPLWVLTSITLTYDVEQWRDASEDPSTHMFEYSLDATSIDDGLATWVAVPLGDLVSIHTNNAGALDGNDPVNQYTVMFTVNGISWAPGSSLWIRWVDPNDPGSDHGMAIDNFSLSAVPEPTTFALVGLGMGAAGLVSLRSRRKKGEQVIAA